MSKTIAGRRIEMTRVSLRGRIIRQFLPLIANQRPSCMHGTIHGRPSVAPDIAGDKIAGLDWPLRSQTPHDR